MNKKKILTILTASACLSTYSFGLSVVTTNNANDLVDTVLGTGITLIDGTASYNDQAGGGGSGTFTDGMSSGIGIESGIILTTGLAQNAVGPNTSDGTSNGVGAASADSATLTFDFTTTGGNLFFNYVFASEEYNEWTNSIYNDIFTLKVNGVNAALIPGTTEEVSINNVNGGNPLGTDASNPHLYNNNDPSDGGANFDIEYDGFTDVFTASVYGLGLGVHTMEFFIEDIGDLVWDSAVFIQANSFSDIPTPDSGSTLLLISLGFGVLSRLHFKWRGAANN